MNLFEKLKVFLHWERTSKPDPRVVPSIYPQLKPFRLPIILTLIIMLIGSLGYIAIDDMSLMDAIYQTGITFTTVGFGEIAPISYAGRIFTITLIITGFAVFSLSVGILVNEINKGYLVSILKERSMLYRIARLKKHFVVCYHNDYSVEVTKELRKNHIPFVVVDPRKEIEEWAKEYKYPYFICAEPHAEDTMLKAHLASAKGLITLSGSISDNIALIASVRLFEKEHFVPKPYYIISAAENISDIEKLKKLGADTVVSPTKLTAQRVSAIASRPDMQNMLEEFLYKSDASLTMEEVIVPKYSWAILKKLKETHIRDITNTSVIGIKKKDSKFIPMPKGDTIITKDSKLLLLGSQKGIKMTKELLSKRIKPKELKYV